VADRRPPDQAGVPAKALGSRQPGAARPARPGSPISGYAPPLVGAAPQARSSSLEWTWQRIARYGAPLWLAFLALLCVLQTVTHAGSRNGFLESSRPLYSRYGAPDASASEGYVTWVGTVPVLFDSTSFLTLAAMFLGERGPEGSGILDHRAAYAYLASLHVPWAGPYWGFLAVNVAFWWGAAAAMWWLVRRRFGSPPLAYATSFLVATGNGFIFMAGLPMSYLAAYASMALLLALAERLQVFTTGGTLRAWLALGWGGGVAATLYFAHIPAIIFWWIYGLSRVPWRYLATATAVTLAVAASWMLFGKHVVGLGFATDNTSVLDSAILGWVRHLGEPWTAIVTYFRFAPVFRTLLGAFPWPWWPLATAGLLASQRDEREWLMAVIMAGLIPTVVILSLLPLSRASYYMYPAVYVLAARGALVLGRATGRLAAHLALPAPLHRPAAAAVAALCLAGLAMAGNLDLLGYQHFNARFHFTPGLE
jgi:hypothetical protein